MVRPERPAQWREQECNTAAGRRPEIRRDGIRRLQPGSFTGSHFGQCQRAFGSGNPLQRQLQQGVVFEHVAGQPFQARHLDHDAEQREPGDLAGNEQRDEQQDVAAEQGAGKAA